MVKVYSDSMRKLAKSRLPQSRPRTKPPEERRDELMNAAQRLFLEQGVGATAIEQITLGANVAKGTFYLYFSSKEDILAALGDRFAQALLANIKKAIAEKPGKDWRGKLAAWARAGVAGYLDSIRLHDVVFYGHRPAKRGGLVDNIIIDHLSRMLQAGMEVGAWSIEDSRFTAVFLFNGLHGIVDDAYMKEKHVNRNRLAKRLERLCFRAVGLRMR
jgi:AcrR family transcriptional regulator